MELDQIILESMSMMENEFYKNKFNFSYSSLNKLLWNPQSFYQTYVLGNREEKDDAHLINGKVIHALLLEEAKFLDNFIISPANLPTGNLKKVIDSVYRHYIELNRNGDTRTELAEFEGAILDVMRDMNYFQNLKTDQQRLDKVITPEAISYWGFLRNKGNKTLIDQESYDFCKNAVDLIKVNKQVCNLIGCDVTEFDDREVLNEISLSCEIIDRSFGLKGIVDNLILDHSKKVIYINDIKTTSKDLKDFPESVEYYNYWLQAAIYVTLVGIRYMSLIDSGYRIEFNFVVIDRNFQVYPFLVKESTLEYWFSKLTECLEKANWHYQNKSYDLPYEFALNKITL